MVAEVDNVRRVVTSTTRPMRLGEQDGVDYFFFSKDDFKAKIKAGAFYEFAQVFERDYYGTLKSEIDAKLAQHIDLLVNLDVQGAATMRAAAKHNPALQGKLVTLFIRPQNMEQISERLKLRGEDDTEIARRLACVEGELAQSHLYDHVIDSKTKDADYHALLSIYRAEKARRTAP